MESTTIILWIRYLKVSESFLWSFKTENFISFLPNFQNFRFSRQSNLNTNPCQKHREKKKNIIKKVKRKKMEEKAQNKAQKQNSEKKTLKKNENKAKKWKLLERKRIIKKKKLKNHKKRKKRMWNQESQNFQKRKNHELNLGFS